MTETEAIIKIKTVLGRKYLELDSQGARKQNPSEQIPLARTLTPYDIYPAFSDLTKTVGAIDTKLLGRSLETIAQTFKNTPASVRTTLDGLSRLSNTIASRDQALRTLLARANAVTGVLADRDAEIAKLFTDGNLLLDRAERPTRGDPDPVPEHLGAVAADLGPGQRQHQGAQAGPGPAERGVEHP